MGFKNFSMWRGRLPHWRADDVRYYVTFRHRRALQADECALLLGTLLRPEGRRWNLLVVCVLPERTELIFTVCSSPQSPPYELSEIVEKAKLKVGKNICKKSGEALAPFYSESFDRIVRDEAEFEERWMSIVSSPEAEGFGEEYACLWAPNAPA